MLTRSADHVVSKQELDTWSVVFEYLTPVDLRNLEMTGRRFHRLIKVTGTWSKVLKRLWEAHVRRAHFYIPKNMIGTKRREPHFRLLQITKDFPPVMTQNRKRREYYHKVELATQLDCHECYIRINDKTIRKTDKILALSIFLARSIPRYFCLIDRKDSDYHYAGVCDSAIRDMESPDVAPSLESIRSKGKRKRDHEI